MGATDIDIEIQGMHCAACVSRVERAIAEVPGVAVCAVNLATGRARVELADRSIEPARLTEAVEGLGYQARVLQTEDPDDDPAAVQKAEARTQLRRLVIGLIFTVPLVVWVMILPRIVIGMTCPTWVQLLLAAPVQVFLGFPFAKSAIRSLRHGMANMDVLVTVGAITAFLYSVRVTIAGQGVPYFDGAAMILTLITLGRYLEARARAHTARVMTALATVTPKTAHVLADGEEHTVPAHEVGMGQTVVVRPGEQVPVDGQVIDGASTVDQSALTGESLPLPREPGDPVLAASVNGNGQLRVRATGVGADTHWQQVVRLVQQAQSSKPPIQRLADRVAGVFVPIIIALAMLTLVGWLVIGGTGALRPGLMAAIAVVIIACPCALGLATPVAVMVSTGRAARSGILVRDATALEQAGRVDVVLLDKTGTLTLGQPQVTSVVAFQGREEDALRLAATAESGSEHPLGRAIVARARESGLEWTAAESYEAVPGHGGRATVDGATLRVGSSAFLAGEGVDVAGLEAAAADWRADGATVVGVARDATLVGAVALADRLRPESPEAVAELKRLGCQVQMVTGDNPRTARAIASAAGIEHVHAEALPADKAARVEQLQADGRRVAMVGDGINDAPALVAAEVGIAIGSGTDVAIEAADVIIAGSDVRRIAETIRLSRRAGRIIRQNLFWALFYNLAAVPLAAVGWLNPMIASAAMACSSLTVVGNSLRLRR